VSAEEIGMVVQDMRRGNVIISPGWIDKGTFDMEDYQVIDATQMYHQIMDDNKEIDLYYDHRMMPIWPRALVAYKNEHGNIMVSEISLMDDVRPYETINPVDWDRVKWQFMILLWAGGRSGEGHYIRTTGPLHMWTVCVYEEGEIADIKWGAMVMDGEFAMGPEERWMNAMLVNLRTYTLAGCSNVELVEPQRPKPQRKRISRTGMTIKEIVIKATSKSYRSRSDSEMTYDVPQRMAWTVEASCSASTPASSGSLRMPGDLCQSRSGRLTT
jgi:hypothetical protein